MAQRGGQSVPRERVSLFGAVLLRVFFDGNSKTTSANSANPEFVARLLLMELVCRVYRSSPF